MQFSNSLDYMEAKNISLVHKGTNLSLQQQLGFKALRKENKFNCF